MRFSMTKTGGKAAARAAGWLAVADAVCDVIRLVETLRNTQAELDVFACKMMIQNDKMEALADYLYEFGWSMSDEVLNEGLRAFMESR